MRFTETPLTGAFLLETERLEDDRGYFARTWCARELEAHGLNPRVAQCSVSYTRRRGTLRGLHYQAAPHEEAKLVRCICGAMYDVIVDLRAASPTFKQWFAVELSQATGTMLYVPEGFAHGFQTLADDTEVLYWISAFHAPGYGRGVRWNDPAFAIDWPHVEHRLMSDRDRDYPDFLG